MGSDLPVLTIGHSTRSITEFVDLLRRHHVELLVDVRAFPGSRRLPWFGSDALRESLEAAQIAYQHVRDLGGRRRAKDAPEAASGCGDAWRNASFRAYAEYVQSSSYVAALEQLVATSRAQRTAIMCSEAVPWRCHRWLVSDTLVASGIAVLHIVGDGPLRAHEMSDFARVVDGRVTWPGPTSALALRMGPPTRDVTL